MTTALADLTTRNITDMDPTVLIDVIKLADKAGILGPKLLGKFDRDALDVINKARVTITHQFGINFMTGLKASIHGMGWTLAQVKEMEAYACTLLAHTDREIPKVDMKISQKVRRAFADAIFNSSAGCLKGWFLGERQDWCRSMILVLEAKERKRRVITTETPKR